ncbi:MAG TPA: hypothetical protein IAC66_06550 [Candidatus Aphodousia gallistercoris]|nr:hypothetical protein [Candidatus Aphodousia gallistercoris]
MKLAVAAALAGMIGMAYAADMPKEINIAYVKAPFNLQNMVVNNSRLKPKALS